MIKILLFYCFRQVIGDREIKRALITRGGMILYRLYLQATIIASPYLIVRQCLVLPHVLEQLKGLRENGHLVPVIG